MAKEGTNPKPSMQREWYCLAANVPLSSGSWEKARQIPKFYRLGNGISCFFTLLRSGIWHAIPKSFLLYRQNIFASCNKILVLWFNRFPRFLLSYNFSHDFKTIYWVSYKLCVRIISGVSRNFLILQYVNKCVAHACILYFLCNKAIPIQCRKKLGTGLISSTL